MTGRRGTTLDRTFRVSVILKGLDGLVELIGGILLLLVTPDQINDLAFAATRDILSADPDNLVGGHLITAASSLTSSATLFASIYLLLHGLVKVVLVWAVLREKLWAFPWMMAFLAAFILYQAYEMVLGFSVGLALLTAFDLFIVWLTALEYRKRKQLKNAAVALVENEPAELASAGR